MEYFINDVKTSRLAFARSLKFVTGFTAHQTVISLEVLEHAIGLSFSDKGYLFRVEGK